MGNFNSLKVGLLLLLKAPAASQQAFNYLIEKGIKRSLGHLQEIAKFVGFISNVSPYPYWLICQ